MKNKKEVLEYLQYVIIGFLLIINGLNYIESYRIPGMMTIAIGILLILFFIIIRLSKINTALTKSVVMATEGIGLLMASYIYYRSGKVFIPYIILLAAIGSFIAAIIYARKKVLSSSR